MLTITLVCDGCKTASVGPERYREGDGIEDLCDDAKVAGWHKGKQRRWYCRECWIILTRSVLVPPEGGAP